MTAKMTAKNDISAKDIQARDILVSLAMLTRLPMARLLPNNLATRGAAAAWAWPVAGLCIGFIAALAAVLAGWFGLSAALAAGLVLVVQIMLTGALHEDGLADSADGLWGGWDIAARLLIMKDSRIGAYGVIALILSLLLRWGALAELAAAAVLLPALIAASALSRAAMAAVMAALPPARSDGLSRGAGQPSWRTVALSALVALIIAGAFIGAAALGAVFATLIGASIVALLARRKLGGQTGDILGATQQVTEILVLLVLTAQLA